jgi:hypothetical protein
MSQHAVVDIPIEIYEGLRAYSYAFERCNPQLSSTTSLDKDGELLWCGGEAIRRLIIDAFGGNSGFRDYVSHDIDVHELQIDGEESMVFGLAEVQLYRNDGNIVLAKIPARFDLHACAGHLDVWRARYFSNGLRVELLAGWRQTIVAAFHNLRVSIHGGRVSTMRHDLTYARRQILPRIVTLSASFGTVTLHEQHVFRWALFQ